MFQSHKWVKMEWKYEKLIFSKNSQKNIWRTIFLTSQHIKLTYFIDRPDVTRQFWCNRLRGAVTLDRHINLFPASTCAFFTAASISCGPEARQCTLPCVQAVSSVRPRQVSGAGVTGPITAPGARLTDPPSARANYRRIWPGRVTVLLLYKWLGTDYL